MSLAGQWHELQQALPERWSAVQVRLTLGDVSCAQRAAALLGPAQPLRAGPDALRFDSARDGSAPLPELVGRLLARLDAERIGGTLERVDAREATAAAPEPELSLVEAWQGELAQLPPDWSDLYVELELRSSDYLERASLLCAPLNGRRDGSRPALRFRVARRFGYGAAPQMVQRCLERCDADGHRGTVHVLWALSDTQPVGTQGPVMLLEGKTI